MTRSRAERITGCEVRPVAPGTWAAFEGDAELARVSGKKDSRTLAALVNEIDRIRRVEAMRRDGFRCVRCGKFLVQSHHKTYRSHGGTHDVANRDTLCLECHEAIHRKKA